MSSILEQDTDNSAETEQIGASEKSSSSIVAKSKKSAPALRIKRKRVK